MRTCPTEPNAGLPLAEARRTLVRLLAAGAGGAAPRMAVNDMRGWQALVPAGRLERPGALPPLVTGRKVRVQARRCRQRRKKRTTVTEVRAARVRLRPPKGRGEPVAALGALVTEPKLPPEMKKGMEWLLLASEGEAGEEDALRTVKRNERRWLVEEYFRVLKSGTKLLARRLRAAASLESCLVFETVHAWKVFDITRLARVRPVASAGEFFTAVEREVLHEMLHGARILPAAARAGAGRHSHDGGEPGAAVRIRAVEAAAAAGRRTGLEGLRGAQAHGPVERRSAESAASRIDLECDARRSPLSVSDRL